MRAHGLNGGMWVKPLTDRDIRANRLGEVFLMAGGEERPAVVRSINETEGRWILALEGVNNRDQAESMRGVIIGVAEEASPALPEGTFYIRDIVGREVVAEDGRVLGRLTGVLSTGSNDVYEISGPEGEILFPALKELVLECPRGGKTMKVRLLPGLLEACRQGKKG
jgi:16S rRNA processing protein RimM